MILEVAAYEIITTAASLLGLKALSLKGLNKRMRYISKRKRLPLVNQYLRETVGAMSKRERWLSDMGVRLINNISKYEELQFLLVLAGRKASENMAKSITRRSGARWPRYSSGTRSSLLVGQAGRKESSGS